MGFEHIEQGIHNEGPFIPYEERPEIMEMRKTLIDLEELEQKGNDITAEEHAMIQGNILQMRLALKHKEDYSYFTEKRADNFRKAVYATYPSEDNKHRYNHEKFLEDIQKNPDSTLDTLDKIVYH